jgi:ribosomal protein S18 acetylase RimI-like enzyme
LSSGESSAYNRAMPVTLRPHEPRDFAALLRLDHDCFPAGIAYSKTMLRYFLKLPSADGTVAEDGGTIVGFILTEENPPLAHVITLDVAVSHRRQGVGSALLEESERNLALRGVRTVLLETATENEVGVAFWQRHGYRIEATLTRYYLRRMDAYEMRKILPGSAKAKPAKKET